MVSATTDHIAKGDRRGAPAGNSRLFLGHRPRQSTKGNAARKVCPTGLPHRRCLERARLRAPLPTSQIKDRYGPRPLRSIVAAPSPACYADMSRPTKRSRREQRCGGSGGQRGLVGCLEPAIKSGGASPKASRGPPDRDPGTHGNKALLSDPASTLRRRVEPEIAHMACPSPLVWRRPQRVSV